MARFFRTRRKTLLGLLLCAAVAQSLAPHVHRLERLGASLCCDEHHTVAPAAQAGGGAHAALHGDCLGCRSASKQRVTLQTRVGTAPAAPSLPGATLAGTTPLASAPDPVHGPAPPRAPPA